MKKEEINEIKTERDLSCNEIDAKTSASSCWLMGIFFLGLKRKAHQPREATLDIKNKLPITKTDINCKMRVGAGFVSAKENQNKLQNNKLNIMQKRVGAILIARKNKMQTLHSGITLISLVITIIILLILAGVTISLTMGENGIFKLAENAGKNYMDAQNNEIAQLQNYSNTIGQMVGKSNINDIKQFTLEAFDKIDVNSNATSPKELNLVVKKDIKKAILVYSCGMGDNGADANAKVQNNIINCNSEGFKATLLKSETCYSKDPNNIYSGSAVQEAYILENIKANDTINIKGYMRYRGGCIAMLISFT